MKKWRTASIEIAGTGYRRIGILFLLLLLGQLTVQGQNKLDTVGGIDQEPVFTMTEEPPSFPGGAPALKEFVRKNLVIPAKVKTEKLKGKTFVKFTVNRDGSIGTVTILKGMENCAECDEEVIKMIRLFPRWIPARAHGEAVSAPWNMSVEFPQK